MTAQPTRDQLRALARDVLDGGSYLTDEEEIEMAQGVRQLLAQLDQAEVRVAEEKRLRMKATAAATEAEARIKAVRELHSESRIIPGTPVFGCAECGEPNETEPCATIRALDT